MGLDKFLGLLTKSYLYFCRVDLLTDGHELSSPVLALNRKLREIPLEDSAEEVYDEITYWKERAKSLKDKTFVSCWSLGTTESFALWKSYLGERSGVAIKTTISKLDKSVDLNGRNILCGKITYTNQPLDRTQSDDELICSKTEFYDFEKEFRMFIYSDEEEYVEFIKGERLSLGRPKGISIKVDLEQLITEIIISPLAAPWLNLSIRDIVKAVRPGLSSKIRKSEIDEK